MDRPPRVGGNGYATEAAAPTRDEAFEGTGLGRIVARTQAANIASSRVAEKIGLRFEREATGRHGEPVRIYSLTREQRPRRPAAP